MAKFCSRSNLQRSILGEKYIKKNWQHYSKSEHRECRKIISEVACVPFNFLKLIVISMMNCTFDLSIFLLNEDFRLKANKVLSLTLFSQSLFKESVLCSHNFFNSIICFSLVSRTTCDSRTRV